MLVKVMHFTGIPFAICSLIPASSVSAAVHPTLNEIVWNTYMATHQQTSVTQFQTVTYGKHTSTISSESTSNAELKGTGYTQMVKISGSTYGSPMTEEAYTASNGDLYFNSGHGWVHGPHNPISWTSTAKQMAKNWTALSVRSISNGFEFQADDKGNNAYFILDSLIEQVLLRNGYHYQSTPEFQAWIMKNFHVNTTIQTEMENGVECMTSETTTLSVHISPHVIKKFWDTSTDTAVYPINAQYKYECYFSYKPVEVKTPTGLSRTKGQ